MSLFCMISKALGLTVLVESKRLDFFSIVSHWLLYMFHPFNDSLSGIFLCNIHHDKENGYVDIVVPLYNNIDMTMKPKISLLPFWFIMKNHIHILRSKFVEQVICICLVILIKQTIKQLTYQSDFVAFTHRLMWHV